MGSKKYKGKLCVYCRERQSEDGDHVVCREFFPINRRSDLPKVPACKQCNHDKSLLEHYLTAVLPFGARHADAHDVIQMTEARLQKNKALHERLAAGLRHVLHARDGGPWQMDLTLPLDGEAVHKLFAYVVKGLAWHHWKLELDSNHFVAAAFINEVGRRNFDKFFAGASRAHIKGDLASGGFTYEGIQSKDDPAFTLWRMSLFGLEVGGTERASVVYGISLPKRSRVAETLVRMFSG